METVPACPSCHSTRLEPGQFDGMAITLDRASTLEKIINAAGGVTCRVCMECGTLSDFRVDPKRIAGTLP